MPQLTWLVTGCSSGLGEQFVLRILERGDKVIATGRNLEKLRHLEKSGAAILRLDIIDSQQTINDTIAEAISINGSIDVLVNNAGYVTIGTWEDLEYKDFLAQFDTNVFGTIKVTRALLPHYRQRRSGMMIFIGSISGWTGHPGNSAYAGSKFALEGMVESLHLETSSFGIKTLLLEPGRFRTQFLSDNNMKSTTSQIGEYSIMSKSLNEFLKKDDGNQPGDPLKLVELTLDLVHRTGVAQGRIIPFRLPLGNDAFEMMKAKCEETLKLLSEWEPAIRSTDYGQ